MKLVQKDAISNGMTCFSLHYECIEEAVAHAKQHLHWSLTRPVNLFALLAYTIIFHFEQ